MARLRIVAGILGVLSLIIPWTLTYFKDPFGTSYGLQWLPASITIYLPSSGSIEFFHYFVNTFGLVDKTTGIIGLIAILAGSVVLFSSRNHPKVGGMLILIGFFVMVGDYAYDEIAYGYFLFIPIGMVLGLVGGIMGVAAKAPKKAEESAEDDPIKKLQKLKSLLDGGVLTDDEFQTEKKKLLEEMKKGA